MALKSWSASVTRASMCNLDQPRLYLLTRVVKSSSMPSKKAGLCKGLFWWLENDSGVKEACCLSLLPTFHNSPELIHLTFACTVESLSSLLSGGKHTGINLSNFWANFFQSVWQWKWFKSIKGSFHRGFFIHFLALLSEANRCINWYRSENPGWQVQMLNSDSLANPSGSWHRSGNSLAKFSSKFCFGPGCVHKHWRQFTSPCNRFLLKGSFNHWWFFPLYWGRGSSRRRETWKRKRNSTWAMQFR